MAQMRKPGCDGIRTNVRAELRLPQLSSRQEILSSLVSALDSVCTAISNLDAEVACVTVHDDSILVVGTEKGKLFLNTHREIKTDFQKFCRGPCLQTLTSVNVYAKAQESETNKLVREASQWRQRASSDTHSNIFILRKMVEELFSTLYSEALGKNSLIPVPYDWILKDSSPIVVRGLPEGINFKKPSEYDTKTLMKILEQSNRIQFTVKRTTEEPSRETKSSMDLNHNSSSCSKIIPSPAPVKAVACNAQEVTPSAASSSILSSFMYGIPMSSQAQPEAKLDPKPMSLLTLGKDHLGAWVAGAEKAASSYTDGEMLGLVGELGQSPPSIHVSKRLLFSIVQEKSEKWDAFIRETEDINTLRECVQMLFNSRYAEALGLDHNVPVPYRKIACDPDALEIIGIPDQIPFKRPCTYGVPKLKRILEERHGVRFVVKRMFDERIFSAAAKVAKEEGRHDMGSTSEDSFSDSLRVLPTELVSNPHSSRSTSACVSPLADYEPGPSRDCIFLKKIKTEPPDGEIIQVTVPDPSVSAEEPCDSLADPAAAAAAAAPPSTLWRHPEPHAGNCSLVAQLLHLLPATPGLASHSCIHSTTPGQHALYFF